MFANLFCSDSVGCQEKVMSVVRESSTVEVLLLLLACLSETFCKNIVIGSFLFLKGSSLEFLFDIL